MQVGTPLADIHLFFRTTSKDRRENRMEFMTLSLPPHLIEYLGVLGLLLLWKACGRTPKKSHGARTASRSPMVHRTRAPRHPVVRPAELSWDHDLGKGVTRNLSLQGCRLKCDLVPPVGAYVSVKLSLQGEECIAIELAAVRWVLGEDLGVEFLSVSAMERQRLQHLLLLEKHATRPVR